MAFTISVASYLSQNTHHAYQNDQVFWAVLGMNANGDFCHLDPATGKLIPMSPNDNTHPFGTGTNCQGGNKFANYFFPLSQVHKINIATDLVINSGQIWFSLGSWLPICAGKGGFAPPSVINPGLAGYDLPFQTIELTYNLNGNQQLNINATAVDFMGFPITLSLADAKGTSKVGFTTERSNLITAFQKCPDTNFASLVIPSASSSGPVLRILSPEHATQNYGIGIPPSVIQYFSTFYNQYIDAAWKYYSTTTVTINISSQPYTGQVQNGIFNFYKGAKISGAPVLQLKRPTTDEVMQCNGVFNTGNAEQKNIEKFVAASMFRGVFTNRPTDPANSWCSSAMAGNYYTKPPVNYYAKILHENSLGGKCYAFAYDDVCNQSTSLVSTTTKAVMLTLQVWN